MTTPRDWLAIVEPPRRDWLAIVEPAPAFAFDNAILGTFMDGLARAADLWHDPDGGEARKVAAAGVVVRNLAEMLRHYRPESFDQVAGPVMALLNALDDVASGRKPPQWLRPKLWDRAPDALELWFFRANAAFRLQQLIDLGTPAADAQAAVFKVLAAHGVEPKTPATIYSWLRKLREGRAPDRAVRAYNVHLARWRPASMEGDPKTRCQGFLEVFARELEARGHARTR